MNDYLKEGPRAADEGAEVPVAPEGGREEAVPHVGVGVFHPALAARLLQLHQVQPRLHAHVYATYRRARGRLSRT